MDAGIVFSVLKRTVTELKVGILKHIAEGCDMNEVIMLRGAEPRKILQTVIGEKVPVTMSHLCRGKWHVVKGPLTDLEANILDLDIEVSPRKKPRPINIQVDQPVGISFEYGYGKFVFETTVVGLKPSPDPTSGGTIELVVPEQIELVQKRSYYRVQVPRALEVNVQLWCCRYADGRDEVVPECCWQGKLVDISAGGVQVAFDAARKPNAREGQFVRLRFTPMPYEAPLVFNAQVRTVFTTVNEKSICFGLQIVGLEASPKGRSVLQRLCNVVERYYRINQTNAKQHDFQTTSL